MTCIYDATRQIYKKNDTAWPKTAKFNKISYLLQQDYITAQTQAKILCLALRDIFKFQMGHGFNTSRLSFVFVHSKKSDYMEAHCLGLYKHSDKSISRFCCFEENWRHVVDHRTDYVFTTADWTTCLRSYQIQKPFKFSYFITATGYSCWIQPNRVIKTVLGNLPIKHDYQYDKSWEKIVQ